MFPGYELMFLVLVPASLFDLWRYRIPNALFSAALMISLIRRLDTQGIVGLFPWFLGIIIPFILCYIFYRFRMLGAADAKLFSVIGSFVGIRPLFYILFYSLIVGAIMALCKMLICHNLISRFRYFFNYLLQCRHCRTPRPYYDRKKDGDEAIIPFSIAISLAVLWCVY